MIEQSAMVERIIRFALEEDLGCGDLTTNAVVEGRAAGNASLIAREEVVLAGLPVFERVFSMISPDIEYENYFSDGDLVPAGAKVCTVTGRLSFILKGERTALNFLQRMSGIATLTRQYVKEVESSKARILDTRKTVPGLRVLDKYAVVAGGGKNHRYGLFDKILVKDNHKMLCKEGVALSERIRKLRKRHPDSVIEVEADSLQEVKEAVEGGADEILLDNMSPVQLKKAVQIAGKRVWTEASGNITLKNAAAIVRTGVNAVSIGALTHSVRAVDISLEIET